MPKYFVATIILLTSVYWAPSFGQACITITDDRARLACYDRQSNQSFPQEQLIGEDACAVLTAYATSPGPNWPSGSNEKAKLCERARKETCNYTNEFISERGRKSPKIVLSCRGG
jgi:hypothetical protein